MVTRVPAVNLYADVRAARESLREQGEERYKFTHVLVLDGDRLVGHTSLVDIALAEDGTPIQSITFPVLVTVQVDTFADECARLRRHYDITQIPVVKGDELLGVVLAESLLKATVDQDTRQMLRVANVGGESADGPLTNSIRARLPWLTVNLGTTFVSAATISLFESTLAQVVALAAFLPVIAGQGGIGGTQTLTLIIRAMALGELVGIGALRLLLREAALGALHGLWLGVLVVVIAIAWQQNLGLALVLGLSMFGNMALAGPVGAGIPLLLRRIGIDPALASAVIVTTFTDVVGFLLFLGIALQPSASSNDSQNDPGHTASLIENADMVPQVVLSLYSLERLPYCAYYAFSTGLMRKKLPRPARWPSVSEVCFCSHLAKHRMLPPSRSRPLWPKAPALGQQCALRPVWPPGAPVPWDEAPDT